MIIISALVWPVILIPLQRVGVYFFALQQLVLGLTIWFVVLKLPTHASKEGGALLLGFMFALMTSLIPLTDIFEVTNFTTFLTSAGIVVPVFMVSSLIMTIPAIRNRNTFFIGFIVSLLLNFAIALLTTGGTP